MANRTPQVREEYKVLVATWEGLLETDIGLPIDVRRFSEKYLSVTGVFADGNTLAVEVSNDGGVNWVPAGVEFPTRVAGVAGEALVIDAVGIYKLNLDGAELVRVQVSATASATTDLEATLVATTR